MLLCKNGPERAICMKSCDYVFLFSPERPDCVQGRLCFEFYSSLKNLKEVYICPAQGQKEPVKGQVRHTSYSADKKVQQLKNIVWHTFL